LNASFSYVTSLSGIECAVNLQTADFSNNTIADLSPLAGLTSLTSLNLSQNSIATTAPLGGITTLTQLDLSYNSLLTNVDGLENIAGDVDVSGCSIADVSAWTGNTGIRTLSAADNLIEDPAPLITIAGLTELNLNDNPLQSFTALGGLPASVTRLDLSGTGVTALSPLASLTNLFALSLNQNGLSDSDLAAISGMTWLVQLYLGDNQLTTLAALGGMTALDGVYAPNNQLNDISALAGLPDIVVVNLTQNFVSDVSPLVNNPYFGAGDTLNLNDNPICDLQNVNALIERGVTVIQNSGGCGT
jgi:internalin A